ncbi:MAG: hypothetical protein WAU69_08500 [Solirubrobacteraceae bacterium]
MALSQVAQELLELLRRDGRPSNASALERKLGIDQAAFTAAKEELIDAGLAGAIGGRLARTSVVPDDLSVEAEMLLNALPADGSTAGNLSLRSKLDFDDETYKRAKRELLDAERVIRGVGYGGTLAKAGVRASEAEPKPSGPGLVGREDELYAPFVEWLESSFEDQELAFARAKDTSTGRGRSRATGRWSRPDVTAVQVLSYEWLPEIRVEVSSYEIKRAKDAANLESVYEAAAHGRWAHRCSLVLEQLADESIDPSIADEVRRFKLGLYTMRRRSGNGFDIREVIKPPLTPESQPEDLNRLLTYFLQESDSLRQEYRRAIGR